MHTVNIPEDRVAVLIGKNGSTKEKIEELTDTGLEVEENSVLIEGDPLGELTAKRIVKAIGRGFAPRKAYRLTREDMAFELIPLKDYASTSNSMRRLKGRVIGENGRSRKNIEKHTNTYISIYGKTVGIIGDFENVHLAKKAVDMLLSGSQHSTVWRMLEQA